MELRVLLGGIRRVSLVILALAIVGFDLGLWLGASGATASAQSSILLDPDAGRSANDPFIGDPDRYVEGELSIMGSRSVAEAASRAVPGTTTAGVTRAVSTRQRPLSSVVDLVAVAESREQARLLAAAVADAYIAQHRDRLRDLQSRRLKLVEEEIQATVDALPPVAARLAPRVPPVSPSPADQTLYESLTRRQEAAVQQRNDLVAAGLAADETRIIEPAFVIPSDGRRGAFTTALLGLAAGIAAGLAVGVIWALVSPKVLDRRQAEYLLGRHALAEVLLPYREGGPESVESPRVVSALRAAVPVLDGGSALLGPQMVAVSGLSSGSGSSVVARGLVQAFAAERFRVVYFPVDASGAGIPAPTMLGSELDDVAESLRMRQVAAVGGDGWPEQSPSPGARPLSRSPQPLQQLEQLRHGDVQSLRTAFGAEADVVILDLAPLLESAAAAGLAREADDLVVVVPVPQQSQPELERARALFLDQTVSRFHLVVTRRRRLAAIIRPSGRSRSRRSSGTKRSR